MVVVVVAVVVVFAVVGVGVGVGVSHINRSTCTVVTCVPSRRDIRGSFLQRCLSLSLAASRIGRVTPSSLFGLVVTRAATGCPRSYIL